jgi:hypothetical protein
MSGSLMALPAQDARAVRREDQPMALRARRLFDTAPRAQ